MLKRDRRKSSVVGRYASCIDGHDIDYIIKRSTRCRYARIEFSPDVGLSVVIPRRYALEQVPALLQDKITWVIRQLTKSRISLRTVKQQNLVIGSTIPFLGQKIRLCEASILDYHSGPAYLDDKNLIVNCVDAEIEKTVTDWYRKQAACVLKQKVDETSALLGVHYGRLTIRGQRTRWGSCSARGTLSFNWKLMMLQESVIDYVVLHEVAHLIEMNHSGRFWKIVERYCFDYRDYRKWLRTQGQQIASLTGE